MATGTAPGPGLAVMQPGLLGHTKRITGEGYLVVSTTIFRKKFQGTLQAGASFFVSFKLVKAGAPVVGNARQTGIKFPGQIKAQAGVTVNPTLHQAKGGIIMTTGKTRITFDTTLETVQGPGEILPGIVDETQIHISLCVLLKGEGGLEGPDGFVVPSLLRVDGPQVVEGHRAGATLMSRFPVGPDGLVPPTLTVQAHTQVGKVGRRSRFHFIGPLETMLSALWKVEFHEYTAQPVVPGMLVRSGCKGKLVGLTGFFKLAGLFGLASGLEKFGAGPGTLVW